MNVSELKPCPFCGNEPEAVKSATGKILYIKCLYCLINKRIDSWNTRYYPAEVQQAIERMKPKKPNKPPIEEEPIGRNFYRICPSCGHEIGYLDIYDFCRVCGQALDWSE